MKKRQLGQTDLKLSPLGLGTVKFGRNQGVKYPQDFEIPDEDFLTELLAHAKSLGINTLDTAPAYGNSEERLGRLLKDQRDDWIIIGKAGEEFEDGHSEYIFTPDHFKMSFERSLTRLQSDYIDIFLIHSDGNDLQILENDALIQTLHNFKDQGLVKTIGASTKTVEGGKLALNLLDTAMVTYNTTYTDEELVLDHAKTLNKSVLLKKVLGSGHNTDVKESLEFALSHPAVASAVIGTITPAHLESNARIVQNL